MYGTATAASFGFSGDSYPHGPALKPRTTGYTTGAFYNLPSLLRFKPGLDARYTSVPGYNGGKAYSVAIRVGFVPYRFPLRPYAEFGGSVASTQLHQGPCTGAACAQGASQLTSGVVKVGGGLDIHINRLFDLRALDYESDTGGSAGMTHTALHSLSGGLVFHLGSRAAYR